MKTGKNFKVSSIGEISKVVESPKPGFLQRVSESEAAKVDAGLFMEPKA